MRHPYAFVSMLVAAGALTACAVPGGRQEQPPSRERDADQRGPVTPRSASEAYFLVTRIDARKCLWPMCGGVYVRQVNQALTSCLLEGPSADCYVAELDLSQAGIDPAALDATLQAARQGQVLLRGQMQNVAYPNGELPALHASAAWQNVTGSEASADLYHVTSSGIVCITYPCPTLKELRLNSGDTSNVVGLDLAPTGASTQQMTAAMSELSAEGLMVSAIHTTVTGPAGDALGLSAVAYYTALGQAPSEPCGNNECGVGEYCCNASCSMCVPEGQFCIQVACAPICAHDECETGDKLTEGCSPCAGKVCAADPYCCNAKWDGICKNEAKQMCDKCGAEPPPPEPPGCGHDECASGAALEASCSPCASTVCAADAFCCANAWDALCASEASKLCEQCAEAPSCAHDPCASGPKLTPSCSPCASDVCQQDGYCCDTFWDGVCTGEAAQLCGGC